MRQALYSISTLLAGAIWLLILLATRFNATVVGAGTLGILCLSSALPAGRR